MIKWLKREKITPIKVCAGDTVELSHVDEYGKRKTVLIAAIEHTMSFDEACVFTFEDEFGMSNGVGGVFGKSK